jgi:hypothetical protein
LRCFVRWFWLARFARCALARVADLRFASSFDFALAGDFLFFASPKKRKQKKGDPSPVPGCAGFPAMLGSKGRCGTRSR